jgi:ubiquinone/menaquinone biosynthesis C-methylase UbiE
VNWEDAIKDLRIKPENKRAVLDNYFDVDIDVSVERYRKSEEFIALMELIPTSTSTLLDIGAGRGIASYAFAKNNINVTALEPDPSFDVGAGAVKTLAIKHKLPITVVETFGETLPFDDNSFDVVYVRQVLHHANDLAIFCKEVNRVLKPGGLFIATREHVLSQEEDLNSFLNGHLLHHLYGGEHAYTLAFYLHCIKSAGLNVKKILNPFESIINFAPITKAEMKSNFANGLSKLTGKFIANRLISNPFVYSILVSLKATQDKTPGRLYSFVCTKPL